MTSSPHRNARAEVLKHPFVLAGMAVVLLLGLVAGVLVIVDSVRGGSAGEPQVGVEPESSVTQGPIFRTAVAIGVSGRTNTTTAVRFAPGARTAVLGTLPRDSAVQIDGRTTDSLWYRVIFPRDSELHGWIDAEFLDITGDLLTLSVVNAEPPIDVDVDLPTIPPGTPVEEFTPEGTPTPEGTLTPEPGLPDLVVAGSTISGGTLFVSIVNQGTGAITADIVIAVFNPDGTALLGGATLPGFTLEAGLSIDINTGYEVSGTETLLLIVDPNGDIAEADDTNNRITVAISAGPPPEETPSPDEEPPPEPPA